MAEPAVEIDLRSPVPPFEQIRARIADLVAAGELPVLANSVMSKEIDLLGSFRFGNVFEEAVELIASGTIDVTTLITARRPLPDVVEAFRLALDRSQSVKVILTAA